MKAKFILYGVIALVVVGVSLFTVSTGQVVKYNDEAVAILGSMDKTFTNYTKLLDKYCEGKQADTAALAKETTLIDATLKLTRTRIADNKVPDDDACRGFQKALEDYIKNAEDFCAAYKKVNEYIAAHNPPKDNDAAQVAQMLDPLAKEEAKALNVVKAAQQTMAKKHNFKLQ